MHTEVKTVFVTTEAGAEKMQIRDETSQRLMKNRLASLLRYYSEVKADPKLGVELLAQAKNLHTTYVAMQEVNRTTEPEVRRIRKKIKQNEALYTALFGQLPNCYREVVNLP